MFLVDQGVACEKCRLEPAKDASEWILPSLSGRVRRVSDAVTLQLEPLGRGA